MSQYLVSLCHSMDDVPLRLFEDRDRAFEHAAAIGWDVPEDLIKRLELPDCSTPCVITVTTFQDGVPVSRVIVRSYEYEAERTNFAD